jgi:hypothetical protein
VFSLLLFLCASTDTRYHKYEKTHGRGTKNRSVLTCAACHSGHRLLPACEDCHGEPHSGAVHQKYRVCADWHSIAHDVQK